VISIPKIIHQTAKTTDIPPEWQLFQKRVCDLHPDWEYHLWTDVDNDALVSARFPELLAAYRGLPKGIMRADIIRYVIMHEFGGWYLDLDYEMLQPFPTGTHQVLLPRESGEPEDVRVSNSIFGSVPGHAFWKAVLADFAKNHSGPLDTPGENDIIQLTGPGFLTRIWRQGFQSDASIFLPPQPAFNPPIPRTEAEYQVIRNNPAVYGIHHCHGTWRALTFWQRVADRLNTAYRRFHRSLQTRKNSP